MARAIAALLVLFAALAIAARDARACGVAYPPGSFAEVGAERTLIVWDAATRTEHFVRKPTFDGDAKDFGFFVPTPSVPAIAKVDDAVLDRVQMLVTPVRTRGGAPGRESAAGGAVEVLQHGQVDDFGYDTLRASDADALVKWLTAHGYVQPKNLRDWAARYLQKGWVLTALRYAPSDDAKDRRAVVTPTLRFSFAIEAPFYPYTEPVPDAQDQDAFLRRHHLQRPPARPVDVWLVADFPAQATGNFFEGLPVESRRQVSGADLATALGDTSSWGFDAKKRSTWTITTMHEALEQRIAFEDLTFAREAPPPGTDRAHAKAAHATTPARTRHARALLALVALGIAAIAAAVVAAAMRERT